MTVGELKKLLNKFNDDVDVVSAQEVTLTTTFIEYVPVKFGGFGTAHISADGSMLNVETVEGNPEIDILVIE